jgi:DNA polymerase
MYGSYAEFNAAKLACRACPVGPVYGRVVESDGCVATPAVMVIGEAPGADEVAKGKPFVGKSGRLLRDTLNAAGFNRDNAAISNVIPCRPRDNVFPSDLSLVEACVARWLREEIAILRPRLILLVGGKALKSVLGMDGITRNRGRWFPLTREWGFVDCMPTYHPSYVQRMEYADEGFEVMEAFKADVAEVARAAGFTPPRRLPVRRAG